MGTSWREYVKYGEKGPPPNPATKKYDSPAAARRAYSYDYEGSDLKRTSWRYHKAQAVAKKRIRSSWYHG